MNGYTIIAIALAVLLLASVFDLGPDIKKFVSTLADLPGIDAYRVRDPAVFAVLVRAMYLIVLLGIIKLLVSRKKDEDEE